MAKLPDPRPTASPEALAEMERMGRARSHADGRAALGDVYVAMFNNPDVAERVGALGEHLRFGATLPARVREAAILRYAAQRRLAYEWAHHVHPATLAGLSPDTIDGLAGDAVPDGLDAQQRAAVEAVDLVAADREIPADLQTALVEAFGEAGVVELVVLCGLYAIMGYMTAAFAIEAEPGLPSLPR
jgi:4-carboxymuconolactone decarboxylase